MNINNINYGIIKLGISDKSEILPTKNLYTFSIFYDKNKDSTFLILSKTNGPSQYKKSSGKLFLDILSNLSNLIKLPNNQAFNAYYGYPVEIKLKNEEGILHWKNGSDFVSNINSSCNHESIKRTSIVDDRQIVYDDATIYLAKIVRILFK
jgi:hypothetical protein